MSDANTSWQGLLQEGETVLWQGKPDARFRVQWSDLITGIFGVFFAAFAVFWMVMASSAGGMLWAFGLLHFTVGIGIALGGPISSWWRQRYSHYSLTNRRAFIATDYPVKGRGLRSWPITPQTSLSFEEDGHGASVFFAAEEMRVMRGGRRMRRIGFEHIPEGRQVFALMTDLQKGTL